MWILMQGSLGWMQNWKYATEYAQDWRYSTLHKHLHNIGCGSKFVLCLSNWASLQSVEARCAEYNIGSSDRRMRCSVHTCILSFSLHVHWLHMDGNVCVCLSGIRCALCISFAWLHPPRCCAAVRMQRGWVDGWEDTQHDCRVEKLCLSTIFIQLV